MKLQSIAHSALVISSTGKCFTLGGGSTVGVIEKDAEVYAPSPVVGNEVMVGFVSPKGKFVPGWLSSRTKFQTANSKKPTTLEPDEDERTHPWDAIRRALIKAGIGFAEMPLAFVAKHKALFEAAVREFGGRSPMDSPQDLARKLAGQVGASAPQLEEGTVKKNKKDKGKAKETAAEAPAKKAKEPKEKKAKREKDAPPARKFSRSVGNQIILACKVGGERAPKAAKFLAEDENLSRKQLIGLRDEVNEITRKLRGGSAQQQVAALALAHVNMGVQRLSRQAK